MALVSEIAVVLPIVELMAHALAFPAEEIVLVIATGSTLKVLPTAQLLVTSTRAQVTSGSQRVIAAADAAVPVPRSF